MTEIVTACYGQFDQLRPQVEQDIPVSWIVYTDDPELDPPAPWHPIVEPSDLTPRLASKLHKCEAGDQIWIDANMEVTCRSFAREALAARHDGIAAWRHPRRDCIYDEAVASMEGESQAGKYADQPIYQQVEHYRQEGHPPHAGLYACGTIAWSPERGDFAAAWMAECARWSIQDQLSFPVVARRLGVRPGVFPIDQIQRHRRGWLENRWLRIHPHRG